MKMKTLFATTLSVITILSSAMSSNAADSKLADGLYAEFDTSKGKIVCQLEDAQDYVSGTGATQPNAQGRTISFAPLASLAPKQATE